ncbi:Bug family tripartite tricarboxylate transporter substrate binding protein [Comamonas thiooxydans]|uniref:Bug family tripartite tricarboxylate transporter substrate binding protein n=1 Tax=Comamonas thiooxydans TaxID=363952 RepID=UPI00050DA2C6|nr:tripartite tricarboxylate transporter substrate binding protein [Comamonas thiooxydans]KGG86212.1 TctC [Comamonas thiooxydans]KGG97841.1 TctC [Comamonas thiooxydans]KGH04293.1 TctC [Comamonas thiooxydans]KGH08859.1 TctC [Comamonas thiooxydans]TZG12414.1 tripartite tricarboxylate transporter substrate binding protein [Comamonas thiooxydans]
MARLTAPRRLLQTSLALLLGCSAFASQAQPADGAAVAAWPGKPVRIVVAFPPAGAADILARSVGEVLQRETKQPFVIDNRPGAGGNIGTDNVAKSAADGYTMLIGIDTTFTVNPFIYKSMPFKNSDLRPVLVLASQGMAVAVSPKTGLKTLEQFIDRGKKDGLTLSSAGYGAPGHLAATILTHATGAKITHVPYKGNAPASTAILAGEVDGGVLSASALIGHIQAGKVNALAVTTPKRNPLLPNVPTMAELGHKNLEQEILFALWVPATLPDPLVKKIELAVSKALQDKPLQERMRSNDLVVEGLTGEAAAKRLQNLSDRYKTVIQATGMKME